MSERKWLPEAWMDESPPRSAPSPEHFLRRDPETSVLQLWPIDADDHDEDALSFLVRDLKHGDVVDFAWHEDRGTRVLTIYTDGSFALDEPFPDDTNCFDDDEFNFGVLGSPGDIAKYYYSEQQHDLPVTIEICGWAWVGPVKFQVHVSELGAASLVEVAA